MPEISGASGQSDPRLIVPTVGRIVWYYGLDARPPADQPLAAIVTAVNAVDNVNLCAFSALGSVIGLTSVKLVQVYEPTPAPGTAYCTWMPYQAQQAAKAKQETPAGWSRPPAA